MIRSRTLNRRLALLASALMLAPANALAGNPPPFQGLTAPAAGNGSATISRPNDNTLNINQSTQSAIYNSSSLNIYSQQSVNVFQPGNTSNALFRCVACPTASQIDGTLWSNGRVFLVNPSGFLFGSGASINVSGFLATTNDITNANFMAGNYKFNIPGQQGVSIVNLGQITATDGGFAALVAPGVRNAGVITANLGHVALASGNGFTLDFYGDQLITLQVGDQIANQVIDVQTGQTLNSLVKNDKTGVLQANGGQVALTAVAARHVVDSVINNKGVIEANSVGMKNGMIVLGAATAATKGADAPKQRVKVSGTLSAAGQNAGEKGGVIQITGENIKLKNAKLDASGQAGGGTVLIGGDTGGGYVNPAVAGLSQAQLQPWAVPTATSVSIDAVTVIDASAKGAGDGGKVVVWSDGATSFNGTIVATGAGGGIGGFVETSGHTLQVTGSVSAGSGGVWLLDPVDLTINSSLAYSIMNALNGRDGVSGTDVIETTSQPIDGGFGNITVNAPITWHTNSSLTLSAYNDIILNASLTSTGGGAIKLRADNTGTGAGTVTIGGRYVEDEFQQAQISTSGHVSIFYNPGSYDGQDRSTVSGGNPYTQYMAGDGKLTAYMLVNTATDLQNIGANSTTLNGVYALGRDIDVSGSGIANFTPLGSNPKGPGFQSFTGIFDGQYVNGVGPTITNLNIAPTADGLNHIGLFAYNVGTLRNLHLSNVTVTANPNASVGIVNDTSFQVIGTLAGENAGVIRRVIVDGNSSITAAEGLTGVNAGGLVGQNTGRVVTQHLDVEGGPSSFFKPGVIKHSSATVDVTIGSGDPCVNGVCGAWNNAGGLVGFNAGIISHSSAHGTVTAGSQSFAGGLVGTNQIFDEAHPFTSRIVTSFATGDVFSAGTNVSLGGLVGSNGVFGDAPSVNNGVIKNSFAMGNVHATGNANVGEDCNSGNCQFVSVGGLVGQNAGLILGQQVKARDNDVSLGNGALPEITTCGMGATCAGGSVSAGAGGQVGGLVGNNEGKIKLAYAIGDVQVGANGVAGGLVGFNTGTLSHTFAIGPVTGAAGAGINHDHASGQTTLGGLVGDNMGVIKKSFAFANVGSLDVDGLAVGGLAGENSGRIKDSGAFGNVWAGNQSAAGGLVSNNNHADFGCGGCEGIGLNDKAKITGSAFAGTVTVGAQSLAGGLVATNNGTIKNSQTVSNVTAGHDGVAGNNSIVGGLVAFADVDSVIKNSTAVGVVTSTGDHSIVAGLVGVNGGSIFDSRAFVPVTGMSFSYLGGLVGINVGSVQDSHAFGPVTGLGGNNVVGGFVGLNAGMIDPSTSNGSVGSGPNSIVGSFVGINGPFSNLPPNSIDPNSRSTNPDPNAPPQIGSTNVNPGNPGLPAIVPPCGAATCQILVAGLGSGGGTPDNPNTTPTFDQPPPPPNQQVAPPTYDSNNVIQVNLTTPGPTGPTGGGAGGGGGSNNGGAKPNYGPSPGPGYGRTADEQQYSGVPPPNETRFRTGELVIQVVDTVPPPQVVDAAAKLGLVLISTQHLDQTNRNVFRFRTTNPKADLRRLIVVLEKINIFASVQPNYTFVPAQSATPAPAAPATPPANPDQTNSIPPSNEAAPDLANADTAALTSLPAGDAAQYVIDKFHLGTVHRVASGRNVTIAVVDSEIDATHPDLRGVIVERFDATQTASKPHAHGTGMAGAIASRFRLLGVAPGVRIIAIKAFDESATSAEATSFQILKGLDYAINKKVKIINMSFAGPRDPMMERTLKSAHDKGIILVAAAGNAGPKSPPLYPGADQSVIAVSATDFNDKPFAMANRGKYIAVAAPGVDVMVPAPGNGYQLTTGTSVAAAHVSGVAALLVERKPGITPDEVKALLIKTATAFSSKPKGEEDGAGLVDPVGALQALAAGAKTSEAVPARIGASASVH